MVGAVPCGAMLCLRLPHQQFEDFSGKLLHGRSCRRTYSKPLINFKASQKALFIIIL